jgi:phage-related protein
MEEAQANLGAAIEPVTTAWTNLKANALEAVLPLVEAVASKIQELGRWMEENPEKAEILKGALVGVGAAVAVLVAAFGGLMIVQTVSKAFSMLGLAMSGAFLPVTLIIAGIAALVAGFLYLWNNCEAFRNFFIALWENIKNIVADVAAWFKRTWDTAIAQLQTKWGSIKAFFTELWAEVKEIAAVAWAAITAVFSEAWELIKSVWDLVGPYYEAIWETIKNIFSVVKAVLSGNFSDAWEAIRRIIDTWSGYFSQVWTLIKGVFEPVSSWFGEKFRAAYNAISNIWNGISGYFSGLYSDILGVFDGIIDDFASIGSNICTGIYNGIVAGWDWLQSTVADLANSLFESAKGALGIASPSKKFRWIGEMSMDGLSVGIEDNFADVDKQMQSKMSDLTARVQGVVAAESSQVGRSMGRPDNGFTELTQAIGMQTAGINSLSSEYRRGSSNNRPIILQLDKRELGRAIVNTGDVEKSRVGTKILTGGVYA